MLTLPEIPITFPEELLDRAVMFFEIEGRVPHPEQLMSYPDGWIEQVFAMLQGVEFYTDMDSGANPSKGGNGLPVRAKRG